MIIMAVPKDIRSVKAKFIGPLTKRQTFAVVPAGVITAAIFMTCNKFLSSEALMGLALIIDVPILACGFIDVYGMPLWVFIRDYALVQFFAPKHRPYVTENTYASYAKQNRITYEYFDGDTEEYSKKDRRKREKAKKKRLQKFLNENPDLKGID